MFCAFDTGGGANALDCGDPPEGGEFFGRKRFHHLPASFELIDLGDELQDLRRDADVPDLVGTDIHLYPFSPESLPIASDIRLHPFISEYAIHDDDVIRFFSPHAQGKSAIFLVAVGKSARRTL